MRTGWELLVNNSAGSWDVCIWARGLAKAMSAAALLSPTRVSYTDTSCMAAETGTQTSATVRLISAKRILETCSLGAWARVVRVAQTSEMHLVLVSVPWTIEQS